MAQRRRCPPLAALQLLLLATAHATRQRPVAALQAWLGELPAFQLGPIELRASLCGDGLGAYLTRAVEAQEVLFVVPAPAFVSISTALSHKSVGDALAQLWERCDDGGAAVLAGYVAHMLLNGRPGPYLGVLPRTADEQDHVLWWSEEELALLAGTSAFEEAAGLRSEAEVASQTLCAGALAADVAAHGEAAVRDAVRAALVSVLSRAYGVRGADGRHAKALVPMLDMLNHDVTPTVSYEFTGAAGDEAGASDALLVARSLCALGAGEELRVSYGQQSDMVFSLHYGCAPL